MSFCIYCGQKLTSEAKFCNNCGKAVNSDSSSNQRNTVYEGEIHKCPNCGEVLDSFVVNCPSCGCEIRNIKTNSPITELVQKLEKTTSVNEKNELIANFYVPNTREDIFDFFILAISNLEDNIYDTDDAWRAKLEQTYHKARISFGNTPEFSYIEEQYKRTIKKISRRGLFYLVRKNKTLCITGLFVVIGFIMIVVGIMIGLHFSIDENKNGIGVGIGLGALGMFSVLISILFYVVEREEREEKEKKLNKRKNIQQKQSGNVNFRTIGKDSADFIQEYYENVIEQLRALGFHNFVIKPVKKGILDTEGGTKEVSIAGNSEFEEDDEFNVNSKVVIRYYTKEH